MSRSDILGKNIINNEILRSLGSILEHGSHSGISVNVGILPLNILRFGAGVGESLIYIHEIKLSTADFRVLCPVKDISLGSGGEIITYEHGLHNVLNLFHRRYLDIGNRIAHFLCQIRKICRGHAVFRCNARPVDGIQYFYGIKRNEFPISFLNHFFHMQTPLIL